MATHISPETEVLEPNLLVFDFTSGPVTQVAIEDSPYVCSFVCPSPGPWTMALEITIQSDPAPTYTPDPVLAVPFFTGRDDRIFVVEILLTDNQRIQSFLLFIPSFTLTSHLETLPVGETRTIIEWDDWGPTGTRLMYSLGQSNVWVCYVHGMRLVSHQGVQRDGSTTIDVYDFNPLRVARSSHQSHDNILYKAGATPLYTKGAFEDIITTSLPYQITRTSVPTEGSGFNAVMCSEDNLIIVGVRLILPLLLRIAHLTLFYSCV